MDPVFILIAAILAIGVWGYVQQGDPLYVVNKLTPSQIGAFASAAGFTGQDLVTAIAIALAESGGDPQAIGDQTLAPTAGPSYGIWQINIGSNANPQYANSNLADPQTNANAAYAIYQAWSSTFGAWSTFNPRDSSTPKYLAFVPQAQGAIGV